MELTSKQRKHLKGLAHPLSPMVQMGKAGFGVALIRETERNLKAHELIKVKLSVEDRDSLASLAETLAAETRSALVQVIGHTVVLYRRGEEPKISFPGEAKPQAAAPKVKTASKKTTSKSLDAAKRKPSASSKKLGAAKRKPTTASKRSPAGSKPDSRPNAARSFAPKAGSRASSTRRSTKSTRRR